jgi:hypothetical protein
VSRAPRRLQAVAETVAALAIILGLSAPAAAQLDPLLFMKRVPPTVIIVVDTSFRMLDDGTGSYYDPTTYNVSANAMLAAALQVPPGATTYRRRYVGLTLEASPGRYVATNIVAVPNTDAGGYSAFWDNTRIEIAKRGIAVAVGQNASTRYRWGLVKLRQAQATARPNWQAACDKPVRVTGNFNLSSVTDISPCSVGASGQFALYSWGVTASNASVASAAAGRSILVAAAAGTGSTIVSTVAPSFPAVNQDLVPAGLDMPTAEDRPLANALIDAKAEVVRVMGLADGLPSCRNTIVVLITGGKDYNGDPATTAGQFLSLAAGGATRRVPIYVVGVKPKAGDEAQLQAIATNSGGRYYNVSTSTGVARVINLALQAGFGNQADFDLGEATEHVPVSPVVGTVDLTDAKDSTGATLPGTTIMTPQGTIIPQRNNIMITAGFSLGGPLSGTTQSSPGFDGKVRAFRTFRPVADGTKPAGYRFDSDGTPIWPDDGRGVGGLARVPPSADERNIFTYVPGAGVIEFDLGNASTLSSHLGGVDPNQLIPFVRGLPLGAIIGSTPAIMDPPSLDPAPDTDYGRAEASGTYAGDHSKRRSIIWFGANDGMLHAVDARTGYEVWAFIPFNLLPKLKVLMSGEAVETFEYFMDSSPKIAEVKMDGTWKTVLVIGQGPGGTFYQAFDVTEAGMVPYLEPKSDNYSAVLQSFNSRDHVKLLWSFPKYDHFDSSLRYTLSTYSDGTPGGTLRLYGDLGTNATAAEKTVGFTWSDPAVGALNADRSINVAIVGSGQFPFFPEKGAVVPNRGSVQAGKALYLIDMKDGTLLGNPSGSACNGTGCFDVGGDASNGRKNAFQADPTVTGDPGSYIAKRAYLGDIDGRYYRFDFTSSGAITKKWTYSTGQPIYASSALMLVGTSEQYLFFSTGSDLLPSAPAATAGTGIFKFYGLKDGATSPTLASGFPIDLAAVTDSAWPDSGMPIGERPSASPSVAGDIVFFTSTMDTAPTACPCDSTSNLYSITYKGTMAYLVPGSGGMSGGKKGSGTPAVTAIATAAGRATAPFVVDQHLYFGTTGKGGAKVQGLGDPQDFNNGVGQVGVRILSWREIR